MQILRRNEKQAKSPLHKPGKANILCSEPEDLLQPAIYGLISKILGSWLEQNLLTPLELLTHKQSMLELRDNAAVYRRAIVAGAKKQVQIAGGDEGKRTAKLEQYLEKYFQYVANDTSERIEVEPARLDRNYNNRIGDVGTADARRHLITSIAYYLEDSPSWGTKVERVLTLLEKSKDEATHQVLDEFLSGFLQIEGAVADTFVEEVNDFALLHDLMGTITGQAKARRGSCNIIRRLTSIMSWMDLPHTRVALQQTFQRSVTRTTGFSAPNQMQGTKQLLWELAELSKLNKKMVTNAGWFTSNEISEEMETQVARRTGIIQLDEYTSHLMGVFAKTIELLRIYPMVFGDKNIERVSGRIIETVMHKDLTHHLATCSRSPMDQLALYGLLEQKIRKAKMTSAIADDMSERLSTLQEKFIRDRKVFHKFRYLRSTSQEKGVYVLDMLMLGAFTTGRCKSAATKLLLYFLPSKEVLTDHMESLPEFGTDRDRSEELAAMYDYFVMSADEEE